MPNDRDRIARHAVWRHLEAAPAPLKMPHQDVLVGDLLCAIVRHDGEPLIGSGAGPGVAWTDGKATVAEAMDHLVTDASAALARLPGRGAAAP